MNEPSEHGFVWGSWYRFLRYMVESSRADAQLLLEIIDRPDKWQPEYDAWQAAGEPDDLNDEGADEAEDALDKLSVAS